MSAWDREMMILYWEEGPQLWYQQKYIKYALTYVYLFGRV